MNKNDITNEEIDSVVKAYLKVNKNVSKLSTAFYKKKLTKLRKKLGWKFYVIIQELGLK